MSKKAQITGVVFMFVFFFLGAIARQVLLIRGGPQWLNGVPQFMAALSLLSPILFSIQRWKEKKFWLDGCIWKLLFLFVYMLIIGVFIYLGFDAYLGR